jgi:N-acetylglucosaminyldiphosphoundecaprenol N-acetyl-beta-D-mannosaminyltransferase
MKNEIMSVRVDPLGFEESIKRIQQFLTDGRLHQIATVNPEFVMTAQKDPEFMETLNKTDLNVADGIGLQFGAKVLGVRIGTRITGVDLTWELAKLASENNYSIYLLGAAEGVAEKAAQQLKSFYPKLRIAGTYAGTPYEPGIVERINNSKADILLVAFGAPKQDKFIYHNKSKLKVKIAIGVGGTFDYIAGIVPRAPKTIRKLGLEWAYRLIKQPQRFNRIITATVRFPLAVLRTKLMSKDHPRANLERTNVFRG